MDGQTHERNASAEDHQREPMDQRCSGLLEIPANVHFDLRSGWVGEHLLDPAGMLADAGRGRYQVL